MATLTEARNLVVAGVLEIPDGQPIAVEVLLIALASTVLGLGTSAVVVGLAGGIPRELPTIGYWLSLAGGRVVALGLAAAALPLLGRTTATSAVRFE
jgi:hypothetical protein